MLEEIVGEIQDEFNDEDELITEKDGSYYISGRTEIDELCEKLSLDYDSETQDISTVAGFAIDIIGEIPKIGDKFRYGNYEWTVLEMEEQRILRLKASEIKGE